MTGNVNFALAYSGRITGTVTDANTHTPLAGIFVEGVRADGTFSDYAVTNSSGQYTLKDNLPTGTYNITTFSSKGYLENTVSGIAVTAGQTATANLALSPSGVITGTVTNIANGQPISGASITAISGNTFGFATTNSAGFYNISTDLTTGSYVVEASYGGSAPSINPSVNVVAGQTTSSVNFQLTVAVVGNDKWASYELWCSSG